jgi:hypothetical protein
MKGKALRRALASDPVRVSNVPIPLISDTTEFITPEMAQEMLQKNKNNRPVNWLKVEEYAVIMRQGEWKLHPQGIILDPSGNIITGQTRLWAVVYSGVGIHFRVSRGSPPETAFVIDRGRPQSSRDLATRRTEKKHSPIEASLARTICILRGNAKPSTDDIAAAIVDKSAMFSVILKEAHRTKKSKAVLMILAVIAEVSKNEPAAKALTKSVDFFATRLTKTLEPHSPEACWGKGTAFAMALEQARKIVK